MPVYNVELYLRECLDSVVNQTLQDIEIICVNDGSHDDSLKILKEYALKDNRIKIINQRNKGLGVARNVGMKNASACYIMFLDADDVLYPYACESAYEKIKKDAADICLFGFNNLMPDGKISEDYRTTKLANILKGDKPDFFRFISVWSKIYNLKFLKDKHLYFIKDKIVCEDVLFAYEIFFNNPKITYLAENLYLYRKNRVGSATTSNINGIKQDLFALKKFLKFPITRNISNEYKMGIIWKWCDSCFYYYEKFKDEKSCAVLMQDSCKMLKFLEKKFDKELLQSSPRYIELKKFCESSIKNDVYNNFLLSYYVEGRHNVLKIFGIKIKYRRRLA